MCTVVLLRRPEHPWPVILGANRDEMLNRPWLPPGRHWPDRADVVGGKDELAGGTWMGLNETGVVACILNRHGTLGPAAGKRSRGELVLEALDHGDAQAAAEAFSDLDPHAYRPFNMVIADNRDAWWVTLTGEAAPVRVLPVPAGLSMFTAGDRNDAADPRIATFLPQFQAAAVPDPDQDRWDGWRALLSATAPADSGERAMSFRLANGFGTSSSALLALPSAERAFGPDKTRPIWLFAAGPPESAPFTPIALG